MLVLFDEGDRIPAVRQLYALLDAPAVPHHPHGTVGGAANERGMHRLRASMPEHLSMF